MVANLLDQLSNLRQRPTSRGRRSLCHYRLRQQNSRNQGEQLAVHSHANHLLRMDVPRSPKQSGWYQMALL
jgi:hypothetical protein